MDLEQIKSRWNEVLDLLLENNQLTLDFADSQKFANPHDFKASRNPAHTQALIDAITAIFGISPTIIER